MADYDLAVIGGGLNGVSIARDAAGRGLRVILLEQGDLGAGDRGIVTPGYASGMWRRSRIPQPGLVASRRPAVQPFRNHARGLVAMSGAQARHDKGVFP